MYVSTKYRMEAKGMLELAIIVSVDNYTKARVSITCNFLNLYLEPWYKFEPRRCVKQYSEVINYC